MSLIVLALHGGDVELNQRGHVSDLNLREGLHDLEQIVGEQLLVELLEVAVDHGVLLKL